MPESKPGKYEVRELKLISKEGNEIDVTFLMAEVNIYEDLFSPVLTGDILLVDSFNILSNLPVCEGDMIKVHFGSNQDDPDMMRLDKDSELKSVFEIIKISNRALIKQDTQTYILNFAGAGLSNNTRTRISRAYTNRKYSDIVKEVYQDKFTGTFSGISEAIPEKDIVVEDTEGAFSVIVPRWHPITLFTWLAARSFNKDAANFFFWEDKNAFHYESIEKIMQRPIFHEYYMQVQNTDPSDNGYFNITDYSYEDTGDILKYGANGMLGHRLVSYDYVTKKMVDRFGQGQSGGCVETKTEDTFSYTDMFAKLTHCDPNGEPLIEDDVVERFADDPGNSRLSVIPLHSESWDGLASNKPEKWLRQRVAQRSALEYLKLTAYAVGNFTIVVGDRVTLNMHSPEWQEGSDIAKKDLKLQGNYIVTALRRKFDKDKYSMVMELTKDNLFSTESDRIWEKG